MKTQMTLIVALLATTAWVPPAIAQETEQVVPEAQRQKVLERIVVTSRKREEVAQDIPAAVTAFTSDYIRDLGLTQAEDFVQLLPNAVFEESTFNINQSISIRGIRPGQDISEPGFGYYRNGFYIGGLRTNFSDFMDLERVEVLRGPQGGLYGRNAVGGAVNFVYAEPEIDVQAASAELGYGSHDRWETRGIANIPIVEGRLAARANAWLIDQQEGEYFNSTLGQTVDTYRSGGGRFSLKWQKSDDVDVLWQLERSVQNGPEVIGVQAGLGETRRTIVADTPSEADKTWTFAGQTINWDTQAGLFTFLTSYTNYSLESIGDQDGGADATNQQAINRQEDSDAYYLNGQWVSNQDQRITWVVGAEAFREEFSLNRPVTCGGSACTFSRAVTEFEVTTDSIAAYGEATISIVPTVDLILSARHTKDEKDLDFRRRVFNPAAALITDVPVLDSATFESTSFGGGLQWRPNDNLNFYVRANEGFRAGGYNTGISTANFEIARLPFEEENALNLEVGAKTSWFDDRLVANAAVFRLTQDNLQAFVPDAFFNFFVDNVGESETDGFELELIAQPTDRLLLTAGFGWIDGKLTGGADFSGPLDGKGIQFGTGTNWNVSGVYRHPLSTKLDAVLQASYRANEPDLSEVPIFFIGDVGEFQNYGLADLSVALETDRWRLRGAINNLTDERYILGQAFFNPFPAGAMTTFSQGRRASVTLSVNF